MTTTSVADQRWALALEAAQLGTWTWDMSAGTTRWDVRLEELHGLPPGGFGGTFEDWLASLHPEDRADCLATVERALADPGPYVLLHRTIWSDGSVHHIECRGTVLTDINGTPTGTTGVAMDVTEREQRQNFIADALEYQNEVVHTLQQALLPAALPAVRGAQLAARYVPADSNPAIGGDWYAVVPLPDGRVGLAIGDVAGHGLAAVADMAAARFSLRALALADPDPVSVLERLNRAIQLFESSRMITTLYGILDPARHRWTYAAAGHCPAIVRGADGTAVSLDGPCDPPLGVAESFRSHEVEIAPGSTLILYTDGLVERRTEPITEGIDRLRRTAIDGPVAPDALCDYLCAVMPGDGVARDDVAILVASVE